MVRNQSSGELASRKHAYWVLLTPWSRPWTLCVSALCPDPPGPRVHTCSAAGGFSTSDYDVGWESPHNGSATWAYSAPDLLG